MQNEFITKPNPRQEKIARELETLERDSKIAQKLIETGLLGEDDQIPEHLNTQIQEIMHSLNLPNIETAREIVILGYAIDTHLESGGGLGEMLFTTHQDLGDLVHDILADEFPDVGADAVDLVIGRTLDTKSSAEYYVDTLMRAVAERKKIMRTRPTGNYIVDTKRNSAEKLPEKS